MFDSVTVTAAARLHLGFLDMNGGLDRRFGSLILASFSTSGSRPESCCTITSRPACQPGIVSRDKAAALKLLSKLLRKHALVPIVIVTDKLAPYGVTKAAVPRSSWMV
jgi:hypothetical protein